MTRELATICVVGAGTMGRGIAQVAISAGHDVSLVDPDATQLATARGEMLSRLLRRSPDAEAMLNSRLHTATTIVDTPVRPDNVVIEAVVEDRDVKCAVFNQALEHFGADAILATNTSSLSVTEIAAGTGAPSRVVGMHFFNPVPAMKLVEVVSGVQTDAQIADFIAKLAAAWGKSVTHVRSAPGFIVNRVARPFYGEALKLLEEGAASAETIDAVMRIAGQFRMGPFELIDLIGNDVNFTVTKTVWEAYNYDPRFAPSLIQQELVAAGRLGRKSGHGFYRYDGDADRPAPEPAQSGMESPTEVALRGDCAQLEELLARAHVGIRRRQPAGSAGADIPRLGTVMVTRGKTAGEESALRGAPVLVLDRCLDPKTTTALAFSSTSDRLTDAVVALLQQAGIDGHEIADTPGLIVARIVAMLANEAHQTVLNGVAAPDDVDTAMELGTNYPLGPLRWCDQWSPATVACILDNLWSEYRDPRYRASTRLRAAARMSLQSGNQAAALTT
jgi:3-hydroxybutyryl-CoA dehydrogenase